MIATFGGMRGRGLPDLLLSPVFQKSAFMPTVALAFRFGMPFD
jgi:hypothetical protein